MASDVRTIVGRRQVSVLFQPIVDLATGELVGLEGLARGPEGPLHEPEDLLAAARTEGVLTELDELCRETVLTTASQAPGGLPPLLFMNVEPEALDRPLPTVLRELMGRRTPYRLVVEMTERALTANVPEVLRRVEEIRARGDVVALDDLGLDVGTVAMLPLVAPEIVKLDLAMVTSPLSVEQRAAAAAATAYARRSGAVLLAEGIHDEAQQTNAVGLGARWGQGWRFGRPAPLGTYAGLPRHPVPVLPQRPVDPRRSPYESVVAAGGQRASAEAVLAAVRGAGPSGVVVTVMAETAALQAIPPDVGVLGMLGRGLPSIPRAYVRELAADDPLTTEQAWVVLGPHASAALCRRGGEHVLSRDPDVAAAIAGQLLRSTLEP